MSVKCKVDLDMDLQDGNAVDLDATTQCCFLAATDSASDMHALLPTKLEPNSFQPPS